MIRGILSWAIVLLLAAGCDQSPKSNDNQSSGNENTADSLKLLSQQIAEDTANASLYHARADYRMRHGDINAALRDAGQAMQLEPGNTEHLILLTDLYQQMNKFEDAKDVLKRVVERDNGNISALMRLAKLEMAYKNYREALRHLDRILSQHREKSEAWLLKGFVKEEQGDTLDAIKYYQEAITYNTNDKTPFLKLGILFSEKGDNRAVDYFNSALNIDPDDVNTMYLLGLHYQEQSDFKNAEETYRTILTMDSTYPHAYYNIGYMALVYQDNYDKAQEYMTKAINANSDFYQAYYNRGYARELSGDIQGARSDYQEALKIFPNYPKAVEGMNRLDNLLY